MQHTPPLSRTRTDWDRKPSADRLLTVVSASLRSTRHSPANRYHARELAWRWVATKWPRLVPSASEMEAPHLERAFPGQALLASTSPDGKRWTLAIAHGERQGQRTWTTEASVTDTGSEDLVAVRTACSDLGHAPPVVAPPKILANWVERLELDDAGLAVTGEPRLVSHSDQLETFFAQVLSRQRALPVIALTNKARSQHYGVDPRGLAEAVRGLAHVTCISSELAPMVARKWGQGFAIAHGTARIYSAGFHLEAAAQDHPLMRPARPNGEPSTEDPGAFRRALCRKICAMSVRAMQ